MIKIGERYVCANQLWESTQIRLESKKRYRLIATGEWRDADIPCGPAGYNLKDIEAWKRPFFLPVAHLRPLDTGEQWFSLLGKIGEHGAPFEIGSHFENNDDLDGVLYCTANDLPFMYWNNHGTLHLEVYELETPN